MTVLTLAVELPYASRMLPTSSPFAATHTLRHLLPAWLREYLGLARERLARRRFQPRVERHRYGNVELDIWIVDPTGDLWYGHDWDMPAEIVLLSERGRLGPGARVFDLGAHHGVVALLLAECVGPNGQIVAVEANHHNAEVARANVSLNHASTVSVIHAAVSDRPGELAFTERANGYVARGHGPSHPVRAETIDTLTVTFGPPTVLFIDVEGYECQALAGATDALGQYRPDLYIEVHSGVGLEKFGTVAELLARIPADYVCYVSPAREINFRPLVAETRPVLDQHSLLVAIAQ